LSPIPDSAQLAPICRKYGVSSLAVFGSFARGEARADSDLDLLVTFAVRVSLLGMVALQRELSDLVGRKVDLQTEAALSPYIKDQILRERQVIYAA
jgi:predicted nucleotidyltransferase